MQGSTKLTTSSRFLILLVTFPVLLASFQFGRLTPQPSKVKLSESKHNHDQNQRIVPATDAEPAQLPQPFCSHNVSNPPLSLPDLPPLSSSLRNKITSYIAFHRSGRECLNTHGTTSQCPSVLVWTCPRNYCAGVGDRMKGILITFFLAIASDRIFLIDWTDPVPLEKALVPAAIDWTLPSDLVATRKERYGTNTVDIPRLLWFSCGTRPSCKRGYNGVPNVRELPIQPVLPKQREGRHNTSVMNIYSDDFHNLTKHIHLLAIEARISLDLRYFLENPHLRQSLFGNDSLKDLQKSTRQLDVMRALIQTLFTPSEDLTRILNERQQVFGKAHDAVHARIGGDMGEERTRRFGKMSASLKETASTLLECFKKAGGGDRPVYLATDTSEFKEIFATEAAKMGITIVRNERDAQHVAKTNEEGMALCAGFVDVFVDLFLLGSAQILTGSRSGFSDLATRFGTVETYYDTLFLKGGICVKKS